MRRDESRLGVLFVVAGLVLTACGTPAPTGPSWVDRAHVDAVPPTEGSGEFPQPGPGTGGCALVDDVTRPDESGGTGSAPGGPVSAGVGNDPYTATGARQVPGPNMHVSDPPASPVTTVVAAPVDPDEHVAARQPDGNVTGPVPPPKVIDGTRPMPSVDPSAAPGSATGVPGPGVACPGGGL